MTDTEGVQGKNKALISELTCKEASKLIKSGVIKDGMLPKVACCLDSLKSNVSKTHIIDGRIKHALLLELFTEEGIGTQIIE
jgi:acetylglutamate kinase